MLNFSLNESHNGKFRNILTFLYFVGKRKISFVYIHEQIKGKLKPEARSFLYSVSGDVETSGVDVVALLGL